jgi:hypothetical protein
MRITQHGGKRTGRKRKCGGSAAPPWKPYLCLPERSAGHGRADPVRSTCIAKRRDPIDLCHHAVATIRVHVSPILAGVLTEPARVGTMSRNATRRLSRSSASCATSRPLGLALLTMCEVRTIPSPYRCGWAAL